MGHLWGKNKDLSVIFGAIKSTFGSDPRSHRSRRLSVALRHPDVVGVVGGLHLQLLRQVGGKAAPVPGAEEEGGEVRQTRLQAADEFRQRGRQQLSLWPSRRKRFGR